MWSGIKRIFFHPTKKESSAHLCNYFKKESNRKGNIFILLAKTFPDPRYAETIRLFIREEQTHAYVLGKFMDMNGISRIKKHWVDDVFRWLRKLIDLENTVTVLITAEIIAKVYYKALRKATGSRILQQLCDQILKDEEQHVAFQSYTLNLFYGKKSRIRKFFNRFCHQVLMVGTICIVWFDHHRVLKTGGYSFSSFFMETMLVFLEAEKSIQKQIKMEFAFSGN